MKKKKKNKSSFLVVSMVIFAFLCLAGGMAAGFIYFMPNLNEEPYYKFVERGEPDEYAIVYKDQLLESNYYATKFEDDVLISVDFLIDYEVDEYIFWDSAEGILTVTTPQKLIRMRPDEAFYTINGVKTPYAVENTALFAKDGKAFMPISFINEFYQITCSVSDDSKIVSIDSNLEERTVATVKPRNASVRYSPDIKGTIAEKIKRGAIVSLFGAASPDYTRIRTASGTVGYIKTNELDKTTVIAPDEKLAEAAPLYEKYKGKRISLVWDQIVGEGTTGWIDENRIPAINIISPTWLSLENGAGDITDKGAASYVKKAKNAGYDVWPLFSNSFNADFTHEALKSTATRQKIISGLIDIARKYGVNGINIDFESYRIEDGYYFTQFMKELGINFREAGLASSVDLPPPSIQNSPTNRAEIGKYVDYLIIMAYDQHWASSPVAGPVAGYDWVEEGISRTLGYVQKEKVVLGLPLYTRVWYTKKEDSSLSSRDFAMQGAYDLFVKRNADMIWEENTKYNKGEYEYEVDGAPSIITSWLETNETLNHKAMLAVKYDLAGLACWKKGLEAEGVWQMLGEIFPGAY